MVTTVPGNHDIGLGDGINVNRLERFKTHFTEEGNTTQIIQLCNHEIVLLDTSSMLSTHPGIHDPPTHFLDHLRAQQPLHDRILFTHIPLWRTPDDQCGPERESPRPIPEGGGYQYQNMLPQDLTSKILDATTPRSVIFSGDDHDYCLIHHPVPHQSDPIPEYTIKSFSMAMVFLSIQLIISGNRVSRVPSPFITTGT